MGARVLINGIRYKRSELDELATRAIFPDFDYALIAAISG